MSYPTIKRRVPQVKLFATPLPSPTPLITKVKRSPKSWASTNFKERLPLEIISQSSNFCVNDVKLRSAAAVYHAGLTIDDSDAFRPYSWPT